MPDWREFEKRKEGMIYGLSGGLWLHRWSIRGRPMAHLVSSDRELLLQWGAANGMDPGWIQYHPLKDPRTGRRVEAWHWDLLGDKLPPRRERS